MQKLPTFDINSVGPLWTLCSKVCGIPLSGGTCKGDSGSGAVTRGGVFGGAGDAYQVDGLVSFGGPLGCTRLPVALRGFTNVGLYKNWINWVMMNF